MLKKSFSVVHIITSLEIGGAQTSLHRLLRFSNNNIDNYLIVLKEENDFYDLLQAYFYFHHQLNMLSNL